MSKIVKITEETHKDLQVIRQFVIDYGTKSLPPEFQPIITSLKDNPGTYKTIIAIAAKFLRNAIEEISS